MHPMQAKAARVAQAGLYVAPGFADNPDEKDPDKLNKLKGTFLRNWQRRATNNPERLTWWANGEKYNICIVTNPRDTLVVLDYDVKNGQPGLETLAYHESLGLPKDGPRTKTPSGGWHV